MDARALLIPLCVAPLGACGSSATAPAPGPEAGRYVATALRGRTLPAPTDSAAGGYGVLLADTLELDGRGGARRAYAERRVVPARGTDTVFTQRFTAAYRVVSGRLEVGRFGACDDVASDCYPNDFGTLVDGRLALDTFLYGRQWPTPVALQRVGP
jgi:hypothetical protein